LAQKEVEDEGIKNNVTNKACDKFPCDHFGTLCKEVSDRE
jgi:hypothetical protein